MNNTHKERILYLCGGLQSSGSTLLSWCFLQRQDMNGFFDANNDILSELSPDLGHPFAWYKTTISCFRLSELATHYREMGWHVRPLLVMRDPRQVWNSLVRKPYGRNGTTAEDPPLRMRFRRFKEDWELFHTNDWPILHFEDFLAHPEEVLRKTCAHLNLPWDPSMMTWPKPPSKIANIRHGSRTFKVNRDQKLNKLAHPKREYTVEHILPGDLEWLEKEFETFNAVNHYPLHPVSTHPASEKTDRLIPHFLVTRRNRWNIRRKPFRWIVAGLLKLRPHHLWRARKKLKKIKNLMIPTQP